MNATDTYYRIDAPTQSFIARYNSAEVASATRGDRATFELTFPAPSGSLTIRKHPDLVVSGSQTIASGESVKHSTVLIESGATLTVDGTLETAELTVNGTLDGTGSVDVIDYYETTISEVRIVEALTVTDGNRLRIDDTIIQTRSVTNNGEIVTVNGGEQITISDPVGELLQFDEYAGKFETAETLGSSVPFRQLLPSSAPGDSLVVGLQPAPALRDQDVEGVWGLIETVEDVRGQPLTIPRVRIEVTVLAPYAEYADVSAVENDLEV
jgi:hypothetical protein